MRLKDHLVKLTSRIPIPTDRTVLLTFLGLASALAWGWKLALLLDAFLFFLCSLDYAAAGRGANIQASRLCSQRLSQGGRQEVEIRITNLGHASRSIQVRDQTPMGWNSAPILEGLVPGRSILRLHYLLVPPQRGKYAFGHIWIRVRGPLGLVRKPIVIPASEELQVYPPLEIFQHSDLSTYRRVARSWGLRPSWRGREGREFESLRDYVEGDDPRRIHWKATARLDRPIVQDFQTERNQIVMILLDSGRLMTAFSAGKSKLDHALEAAMQLAQVAISGGDQVGIVAFADKVISFVPPRRSTAQLQRLLQEVVDLRPSLVTSQYQTAMLWLQSHVRRRSLVVIYTDLLDEVASEALLSAIELLRPRHLPLCVAIAESEWEDLLNRPPNSIQDVYERALLQILLRQRRKALWSMVQKGALALDLPPSRLSVGTLERYLEVKKRGLL